ncbi:hypothetical protein D9M70_621350 [compost metagenome]
MTLALVDELVVRVDQLHDAIADGPIVDGGLDHALVGHVQDHLTFTRHQVAEAPSGVERETASGHLRECIAKA